MIKYRFLLPTVASFLVVIGCQKKITKISEPVEVTKPVETVQYEPDPVPVVNIDSLAKQVLVPIYFEYNRAELINGERAKLEAIGPFLSEYGTLQLIAQGHCDERGSSEYNMGLGEKRAQAIKEWLVSYGINSSRIQVTSYGKERPARFGCEDDDCHTANRRVEWMVIAR